MITEGDRLIVKSADDNNFYNILRAFGDQQKVGKWRVSFNNILGEPYNSFFELNGRKFNRISDIQNTADATATDADQQEEEETFNNFSNNKYVETIAEKNATANVIRGDNSGYVDSNTAQKLKDADILKLREDGLAGTEIIKTLIENSDTFAAKTDFAQEKWIKRKEKKYVKKYQILPCNPFTVCESSFRKNKDKVSNMRYDSFAQLLSFSGVHAGCHVLVVESMVGMVVGALAYRMRGEGRILTLYGSQQPHLEISRCYNLEPKDLAIIEPFPAIELGPAAQDVTTNGFEDYKEFILESPPVLGGGEEEEEEAKVEEGQEGVEKQQNNKKRKLAPDPKDQINSTGRSPASQERLRSYLRQGVDR
jgi:hypothetical protein